MLFLFAAMVASFLATLLLVRYEHTHRAFSSDTEVHQVNKVHVLPVTRIGGVGVFCGILISWALRYFDDSAVAQNGLLILLSALPVFTAGLVEDTTKRGWHWLRFFSALVSGALGGWLLQAWLVRVDLIGVDALLLMPVVSVVFTCFAVAGVTHAFNIIDGFNGLSTGVATLILLAISYVAFKTGDVLILAAGLTGVGAIVGFMLWNFPRGLIYLGDGGAYLIGFWVAELSVLLVVRNPQVSPWFPLVLCSYPVFETLFSMYRRIFLSGAHPMRPDAAHLHHMIYRRLVRWAIGTPTNQQQNHRNSMTAPYLWILTSVGVIPAVLFWRFSAALQVTALMFAVFYVYGYAQIVRFRAPRWWVIRKK